MIVRRSPGACRRDVRSIRWWAASSSSEFLRQAHVIVDAWKNSAKTRYGEFAGKNHFTVVDALTDASSAMTMRVVELARQVAAMKI